MKITGGIAGGIPIEVLKGSRTRPTTDRIRESVFGALSGRLEGAKVLDLFAGSGALGLEAASRGATSVNWVEKHEGTARNIQKNITKLSKSGIKAKLKVHATDSYRYIKKGGLDKSDLIFVDPPYAHLEPKDTYLNLLRAIFASGTLEKDGVLVVEASSRLDLPETDKWQVLKSKNYGSSTLTMWQLS